MQKTREDAQSLLDPKRIEDLLLYRLSRIIRSSSLPLVRLFEGELGITRRHWHLLALVVEHGSLTAAQIQDRTWLDRPQISRGLDGLLDKGLVSRERSVGRTRLYQATAEGEQLYRQAFARVAKYNRELAHVLTPEQCSLLDHVLLVLQKQINVLASNTAAGLQPARRGLRPRAESVRPKHQRE